MFIMDRPDAYIHGIWLHRIHFIAHALAKRGHGIKQVSIGKEFSEDLLNWPDVVIFGRTYPDMFDPVKIMREFKRRGKRILYDLDDDFWNVSKDNPSVLVSNALKDQYEGQLREADALITPSEELAKKIKKHFKKPYFICPNGINEMYPTKENVGTLPVIGYMAASSHWEDLGLVSEAIAELAKKHDFIFSIYGLTSEPMESFAYHLNKTVANNFAPEKNESFKKILKIYNDLKDVRMLHIPFMPPELHPSILSRAGFDIGIAPLIDNEFNRHKSCVKFYEYAAVGTVTLASDVLPYSKEVNYRAKNTTKDWVNKLEKLLVDKDFREKILKQQQDFVFKNNSPEAVGLAWELACQRPGGLKVLNQS